MIIDVFGEFRRWIGAGLICLGLIMAIPAVGMFILSSVAYGSPEPGYPVSKALPIDGTEINFTVQLTAGNDYDIKVSISVTGTAAKPATGAITIEQTASATNNLPIKESYIHQQSGFNSTTFSDKFEYGEKLPNSHTVTLFFEVTSASTSIQGVTVQVSLYANPHRTISGILGTIGLILLIPSFIVCCFGAMLMPNKKQGRVHRR